MSLWRRTALERVPSCRRTIAESKDVHEMWLRLKDELGSSYNSTPPTRAKMQEIYGFALECSQSRKPQHLTSSAWLFFHGLMSTYISGDSHIRQVLPTLMTESDFTAWLNGVSQWDGGDYSQARQAFFQAKRHS